MAWLRDLKPKEPGGSVYDLALGPRPEIRTILGQTVALGPEFTIIEDAVLQNHEEALSELSKLDGRVVVVKFRPRSGMGRYHFPQAPCLPDRPWDEKIEACVRLEARLNERLAEKYNELAAATLDGLRAEEIKVLTERSSLGEDAHLIRD